MYPIAINQPNLITFVLIDSAGNEVAGLGTSFTVQVSKAGSAFSAGAGTKAEIGSGWYAYIATALECDTVGPLSIKVTGAGVSQQNLVYPVSSVIAGATQFTYTLTSTVGGTPIADALVWFTTDSGGSNVVASALTDALGQVKVYLAPGTYYVWRSKEGFSFVNPDVEVV